MMYVDVTIFANVMFFIDFMLFVDVMIFVDVTSMFCWHFSFKSYIVCIKQIDMHCDKNKTCHFYYI